MKNLPSHVIFLASCNDNDHNGNSCSFSQCLWWLSSLHFLGLCLLFINCNCYKMAENIIDDSSLPVILDGTFFKIIKEVDNKVIAKCVNCVNNELSGSRNATSNFLRHLRVSITLVLLCN